MNFDTVIWDWNGTLLDDAKVSYDILNLLLKTNGYQTVKTIDDYKQIFGFPIKDYYTKAGFDFSKKSYEELAREYIKTYNSLAKSCTLHKNAVDVLTKIKQSGVRQVILSASEQNVLLKQIGEYNITNLFDEIIGTSDIFAKGKIDAAKAWQQKTGAMNAVMIGDTVHDFEVAGKLFAKSILFTGGHHSKDKLTKTGAVIVDDLKDILIYI